MAVTQLPARKIRDPKRDLPTMYDLPSEDPEEGGLPDEFHVYQPQLLRESFDSPLKERKRVFIGSDMNLYYDPEHTLWYKKPDWFLVIDTPRFYREQDLRMSYVVWDEPADPYLVVELLSPGTEKEDLGEAPPRKDDAPPGKWEVYERILRIPYYVVFDRYINQLKCFKMIGDRYRSQTLSDNRIWLPEIGLGLGLWTGEYDACARTWLRWYDADGHWLKTPQEKVNIQHERAEQERDRADEADRRALQQQQRAEQEHQRALRLAERLKALGMDPDNE